MATQKEKFNAFLYTRGMAFVYLNQPIMCPIVTSDQHSRIHREEQIIYNVFRLSVSFSPPNLGAVSEEQGEKLHQDISVMETRYQGQFDPTMMENFYWFLRRETDCSYKRKSKALKQF